MANFCKNCRYYNFGFCTINVDLPSPYSTCFRYSPKDHNKSKKVAKYERGIYAKKS